MSIYRRRLMIANALKKSDSNINYPGLIAAWSAKGKSNDDADRAVLRDLTGNGHDLTLNNFAFSRMSGYGGYNVPQLSSWKIQQATGEKNVKKISLNKLQIKIVNGALLWSLMRAGSTFKIRCSEPNAQLAGENCIYTKISEDTYSVECTKGDRGGLSILNPNDFLNKTIEFELLPEYSDALVFDGVDDYGVNSDMPTLTDYTIIAEREFLYPSGIEQVQKDFVFISYTKNLNHYRVGDLFSLESRYSKYYAITFATQTSISVNNNRSIVYQNKNNYNGKDILYNEMSSEGFNTIRFGRILNNYTPMVFYSAYLFDRSLDEQEIKAFIRKYIDADYLLPSEIPTPDCYYDFTSGDNASETRDTIVDLSGNGNDAKAYNFAWNEEGSGYKDGALQFDGTDDYISLEAFDSGFKTMFMLCKLSKNNNVKFVYDQRYSGTENYGIRPEGNSGANIAYYSSSTTVENKTYINGILNKTIPVSDLFEKKHAITMTTDHIGVITTISPKIGSQARGSIGLYANFKLYRFLGFKESLTEEQIQYVIKKYNLLDGVDEIKVS